MTSCSYWLGWNRHLHNNVCFSAARCGSLVQFMLTEAALQPWLGQGQRSMVVHAAPGALRCRRSLCRGCTDGLWLPQATSTKLLTEVTQRAALLTACC